MGSVFIGHPDGVRQQNSGRHHHQRMAGWEDGQDSAALTDKAKAASSERFTGAERGTASQCRVGGWKQRVTGRQWRCRTPECALSGQRDVVGRVHRHPLAFGTRMAFPARLT